MKTFIIVWLMVLSIAIVALIGHIQRNAVSTGELRKSLRNVKTRVEQLEDGFERSQDKMREYIKTYFKDVRVIPLSCGAILVVEKEE